LTQSNVIKLNDADGTKARQLMAQHLSEKALLKDEQPLTNYLRICHLCAAIVQATTFINNNGISLADYISLFREPRTEVRLFSKHFEDSSRYGEMESTIARHSVFLNQISTKTDLQQTTCPS